MEDVMRKQVVSLVSLGLISIGAGAFAAEMGTKSAV